MTSGRGQVDELLVELVAAEHQLAFVRLVLLPHARPHVGVQDVGAGRRLGRVVDRPRPTRRSPRRSPPPASRPAGSARTRAGSPSAPACRPSRRRAAASAPRCCRRPRYVSVRPSGPPSRSRTVNRSASAWHGCSKSDREFTTGTEEADGEQLQPLLLERAEHDRVDVAAEHAPGVLDGLAAPQLELGRRDHERMGPQLRDAHLERHPRPGGRLLEDQRHRAPVEPFGVRAGVGLHLARQLEESR